MNFFALLLVFAFIFFGYAKVQSQSQPAQHCMTCGIDAKPKTVTKGSIAIELILWLCFLVPGLIYSIWRLTTRGAVCSGCGGTTLVPMDSPAALMHRKLLST